MKLRLLILFSIIICVVSVTALAASSLDNWTLDNSRGFGEVNNIAVPALSQFAGQFYAGTRNESGSGAQLWRRTITGTWASVSTDGFGDTDNFVISDLFEFGDKFYAGIGNQTDGGQVWRSDDGAVWNQVTMTGFDPTNGEIMELAKYKGYIYASTGSYTDTHGAEIWRSDSGDSGDWSKVVSNGFDGDVNNKMIVDLGVYRNTLFAGTDNVDAGAEVWSTNNGITWTQVNVNGFGDWYNQSVTLEKFQGYYYAGTYNYTGSDNPGHELWRCKVCDNSDWEQVPIDKGFGDTENRAIRGFEVFYGELYGATYNRVTGMQVWKSVDGLNWSQSNEDGFEGDPYNVSGDWNNSILSYNSGLYVGTRNSDRGGQIWRNVAAVPLQIVKSADFLTLPEPGGTFSFSVDVTNNSTVYTATLSDIDDNWAGDAPLTDFGSQDLKSSCVDSSDVSISFPHDLGPGGTITCKFSQVHSGNAGDSWTDAVTVAATDDDDDDVGSTSNNITVSLTMEEDQYHAFVPVILKPQ